MIGSLTLGQTVFSNNIIQGPLAGVSCAPFRRLTWEHSEPAFSCTEMISCKTLIHSPLAVQQRFVKKDTHEGPVCFQLAANNPAELSEAVKRVTDLGADLIDLNCGCPVKKIRTKGYGSRLLTNTPMLYQLISAMKQNTHLPISIKIRVEGGSDDRFHAEVAEVIREAGADFVTVHGRHWNEHYETPCKHEDIQFFVENLPIPVIGNGDIACIDSLKTMLKTGCAGVMIGRAGVGQPWLIKRLIAEYHGQTFTPPTLKDIGYMFIQHITELADLLRNEFFAVLQARKFGKYYARELPLKLEFCEALNQCQDIQTFRDLCLQFFR